MRRHLLIGSIGSLFAFAVGCSDDTTTADASSPDVVTTTDLGHADTGAVDAGFPDVGAPDVGTPDSGALDVVQAADVVDVPLVTDHPAPDVGVDGGAPACTLTRALITTSDFVHGGYALSPIAAPAVTVSGTMSPDQDHVPVESGCIVYNLFHSNDAIAVLNPASLPAALHTIPLRMMAASDGGVDAGAPAPYSVNPYDVLTLSATRALVVQYALARIGIINPTLDGAAGATGSVDLTPVMSAADTDGAPEASNIVGVGDSIFVSLQNLNSFAPVTNGTLAVLNASTLALVDTDPATTGLQPVQLTGRNPLSMVTTPSGASIVVAEAGVVAFSAPQSLDGRIEKIDPATYHPTGMAVTEAALGGDVSGVAMLDETHGWAVVTRLAVGDASVGDTRVMAFDLAAGTVGATILTTGSVGGIARDPSGNIWVLDRSTVGAGVRVYHPDGTALTTMTLATGAQPPYGVAFVP